MLRDGLRLGGGPGDRLGGAEGADVDGWIEAALIRRDVRLETKIAAFGGLVGHAQRK